MGTIRVRFILVALAVSFFAIGMAAFLNYFKYKSTFSSIVRERMLVIGRGVENTVQSSLSIGMQFTELSALPTQLQREKATDRLIRGIDLFDHTGQAIYSTDRSRVGQRVPATWVQAADRSKTAEWAVEDPEEHVAGISLKNNFNLTVGYLAVRYSRDDVQSATAQAGREILFSALFAFAGIALVAPLALIVVIRRFERDIAALESATSHLEERGAAPEASGSAFDTAIGDLRTSLGEANAALDDLRVKLDSAR